MARIDALPSIEIIKGLKGILDFYLWKGLPCVRAWPTWRPERQSDASKAAALFFGAVVKSYSLLGEIALSAYKEDALDQPRTARDIFVSGVFGKLHEADMSDFLSLLVQCRDFLSALTAVLGALDSIDTDELVVNVDQSALPAGAATAAAQALALAQLQNIADLQDALQSKALDRLLVRGMDQLFSVAEPLRARRTALISGADGYVDSATPGAGWYWVATGGSAHDSTSPNTAHRFAHRIAPEEAFFAVNTKPIAANQPTAWQGKILLLPGHFMRVYFPGGLPGDTCTVDLVGYYMTLET